MADAKLEQKLERLLDRLEILLPKTEDEVDWSAAAFRWRRKQYLGMSYGVLEPIHRVALVDPDSIKNAISRKPRCSETRSSLFEVCPQIMFF